MSANSFSCLWPRAIIELCNSNEPEATATLSQVIKPYFDHTVVSGRCGIRIDVTHLQQRMGSAVDIANHVQQIVSEHGLSAPDIGVASDPLIASYAARHPQQGRMQVIAPWEARLRLREERISRIGCSLPGLAQKMERAGIRTGEDLTRLPERILRYHFGDDGLQLWRACKGIGGASAPEVVCRHNAVSCRVVLPPRTASKRSVISHARRVSGAFVNSLQRIRRPAQSVQFVFRDEVFPDGVESGMLLTASNPPLPQLLHSIKLVVEQAWSGAAVTHLELKAGNLSPAGGQLELFNAG
jgi:nucleotidyltransferase/DNA polymerase involved in DNA repair